MQNQQKASSHNQNHFIPFNQWNATINLIKTHIMNALSFKTWQTTFFAHHLSNHILLTSKRQDIANTKLISKASKHTIHTNQKLKSINAVPITKFVQNIIRAKVESNTSGCQNNNIFQHGGDGDTDIDNSSSDDWFIKRFKWNRINRYTSIILSTSSTFSDFNVIVTLSVELDGKWSDKCKYFYSNLSVVLKYKC